MKHYLLGFVTSLIMLLVFLAASNWARARNAPGEASEPPIAYAWGHQLTVYYPEQKKLYVYSELGGGCVFAYTLSTPGGLITRENCR